MLHRRTIPAPLVRVLLALIAIAGGFALPARAQAQTYGLVHSTSSNRAAPAPLGGATVSDSIYVFTTPDTNVVRVRFWLDQPAMTGTPFRTENTAPFDFAGGNVATATPWNTDPLADGSHTISARLDLADGSTADVHATFTIANDLPTLAFSPASASATVVPGGTATSTVTLSTSTGATLVPTLSESASWLSVSASGSTTPLDLTLNFDSAGLAEGTYTTTVTATSPAATPASLPVTFVVGAPVAGYQLMLSLSPNRSSPVPLAGQVTSDSIYVFTTPSTGVTRVLFFIDNPTLSGTPYRTENSAPHDLAGGSVSTASPFDTGDLDDGVHTISARIDLSAGGSQTVHATFTVANAGALLAFSAAEASASTDIGGTTQLPVGLTTSTGQAASFTLSESAPWLSLSPSSGVTPASILLALDASGLAYGSYTAQVQATAPGFIPATLAVELLVAPGTPSQIHLSWVDDPSTSLTVAWRTASGAATSQVEYRAVGETTWSVATGGIRPSGTSGVLHEATLTGLSPATEYEYRVPGDSAWSEILTARTAPPPGPADFSFVYFADTGIAGRLDGLTTGTERCIEEIAALEPLLVLGGGDYAYFNTDTRFDTLDDAIDAWFDQMQPVASRAPLLPTYGNHEIFLGEGFEPWSDRFPTPVGFDQSRTFSFDVGDVHFISIHAAAETAGLRSGTISWLDADMTAAEQAGARWIIPYMHVSPFSEGENHPSNLNLRAELGPLFEAHDVKIVLTSHDQSYERTFPIVGVPSAITATSSSLSCYTAADGITWVKISPAGKISNQNADFSQWNSPTPPSWTAYRHNTLHHFAHVTVSAAGVLDVSIIGLAGDGSAPVVVDSFRYSLGACPPVLDAAPRELAFSVEEDESASLPLAFTVSDGSNPAIAVASSATWLSVTPTAGNGPNLSVTATADATGLSTGTYSATITATADGVAPTTVLVELEVVPGGYALFVSDSPSRSNPVELAGAVVSDDIYVFLLPEAGVDQVLFYVDDPSRTGSPHKTEGNPPWDLEGSVASGANPFDTNDLADGLHTITAAVVQPTGTTVVHASFLVSNTAPILVPSPVSLALAADASGPAASGTVQLTTTGSPAAFSVSIPAGAPWLTATPVSGATPASILFTADPAGLAPGTRSTTVTISAAGFAPVSLAVGFEVIDDTPTLSFGTSSVVFAEEEGGTTPQSQAVLLASSEGTATATIAVSPGAPWLALSATDGATPLPVTITVDPTGLPNGTHTATLDASAPGHIGASLTVTLSIQPDQGVMVSFDPSRAAPVNLNGQVVAGDIYVFYTPEDPEIDYVDFWIDDPTMTGTRHRRENSAPYDLEGASGSGAAPFDTTDLDDGAHSISTRAVYLDGDPIETTATFQVLNDAPALDFSPGLLEFQLDPGATGAAVVAVVTTDLSPAVFSLDPVSAPWLSASVTDATTPGEVAIAVDTAGLSPGTHTANLRVTAPGFAPGILAIELAVTGGLEFFAGDDQIDTAVSIVGTDWYINGQVTYPGVTWLNPANGLTRDVEGVMMNSRMVQGVYDDLDGSYTAAMSPWDPRENTEDFIANMPIWRAHGLLAFNLGLQGGGNPAANSSTVDCNPFGSDGRRCFDDWDAGLDTPYSQFLVRAGSIIRVADDLGMVVELSPFYWGQDQRLADNDAVLAAMDGVCDWVLENGWTNVIIEVANEASYQPSGVYAFHHTLLQTAGSVDLMAHVKAYTSGPAGAHLPHGRLLVSVSGHGGYVPNDAWIDEADYVIFHGNGQSASNTATKLNTILGRAVYQADPKPIYTNEHNTDLTVIDPHLQRHASWGYHGREQYQRTYPTTNTTRWTISKDPAWWNKLAEITDSDP